MHLAVVRPPKQNRSKRMRYSLIQQEYYLLHACMQTGSEKKENIINPTNLLMITCIK